MKVLDSRILVQPVKSDEAVEKIGEFKIQVGLGEFEIAKVIAVGPKTEGVVEGETVYIYTGAGKKFSKDGVEYRVVTTSEVIVVL